MRSTILYLLFLLLVVQAQAQQDVLAGRDSSVFENERIERLEIRAKPLLELPEIPNEAPERSLTYVSPDLQYKPGLPPPRMIPLEQDKPTWERLYNHHVRLGLGLWLTPLAEVHLGSGRQINKSWGAQYRHLSTPVGHTGFANFGDHRLGVQGRLLQPMYTVYTEADFRYYRYNFYGKEQPTTGALIEDKSWRDSIRQHQLLTTALLGVRSNYTAGKLSYDVPLKLEVFGDRREAREWYINASPSLEVPVYDSLYARVASRMTFGQASTSSHASSRIFLDVTPQLAWYNSVIRARVGLRANLYSDTAGSEFNVYPAIEAEVVAIPKYLSIYASAYGQTHFNRRMDWMQDNPWMAPGLHAAPTFERYRATFGLRGNLLRFTWQAEGYLRQARNQVVFVSPLNDSLIRRAGMEQGYFYAAYEPEFRETGIGLELQYDPATIFRAGLKVDVRSFSLDSLSHNFHVAPVMVQANGAWGLLERKLWLNLSLRYIGARPLGFDREGQLDTAEGFVDANLGADYRLSKRFSIFVEVNNLLNQTYYRWRYYVERPLDVRAGVSLAF
jgi:hypothetical protein